MQIIIVEDEENIRKELKQLLQNAMYEVTTIESFSDVAGQITRMEPMPDLVLLDLNLPEESGFAICTKIREYSEIPVIFLTSRTDSMDELTGILKGADDYITKPFNAPSGENRECAEENSKKGCRRCRKGSVAAGT